MKRTMCMAAAFLCATAIGAFAQSPSTTTASSSTSNASDKITVTGCLQGGSSSSSTTASSSTASSGIGSYVLMTSPMSSSSTTASTAGTTAGTVGTTGTTPSSSARMGTSYTLDGHNSELKNHVGHRIEVTGTVEPHANAAGSSATSTTTSGSASSRMSTGNQMLKVSSVRMIAADCSAK